MKKFNVKIGETIFENVSRLVEFLASDVDVTPDTFDLEDWLQQVEKQWVATGEKYFVVGVAQLPYSVTERFFAMDGNSGREVDRKSGAANFCRRTFRF